MNASEALKAGAYMTGVVIGAIAAIAGILLVIGAPLYLIWTAVSLIPVSSALEHAVLFIGALVIMVATVAGI